ncbi:hypothetical protein [Terrarubrum flagellatum]|uniref:hypothetical protein n=1 Tax=Terrirubrum flagellatum TaxID=2895980 RepID=UPI00314556C0
MFTQREDRSIPDHDTIADLIELLTFSGGKLPNLTADEVKTLVDGLRALESERAERRTAVLVSEHLF